ncbi:MAG: hypothetical protein R3176_11135, partial [Woeseiaceae bacterium]|nr:hypothetical protein [Woeseiaceae bacterium]
MMRRTAVCVAWLVAGCGPGADTDASVDWVAEAQRAALDRHAGDADTLVLRGIVADRKLGQLDLLATAGAAEPELPLEVLVAGADSAVDRYLAKSTARTEDLLTALRFIGMTPGHPREPERLLYWPKGERVIATVARYPGGGGAR